MASAAETAEEKGSRQKRRTGTSKYDFVKVKVWLGNMDHHYVLSRFLISRMLTVTRIPYIKAVKIALEVKKYFVDNNRLDITQAEFETVLFNIMKSKGFDDQYKDLYLMVTQFFQQRQPLVILICGTACTGKSTLAQQLAARLNLPNVMQTDIIYELLRSSEEPPLAQRPLRLRDDLGDEGLVQEFRRECRIVRKGMDGDLTKTLTEGKPIILEGLHLDPGLYIQEFGQLGIIMLPAQPDSPTHAAHRSGEFRDDDDPPELLAAALPPWASSRNVVVVGRSQSLEGTGFPFFAAQRSGLRKAATVAALPTLADDEPTSGGDGGPAQERPVKAHHEEPSGKRFGRRSASMPSIQEQCSEQPPSNCSSPPLDASSDDGHAPDDASQPAASHPRDAVGVSGTWQGGPCEAAMPAPPEPPGPSSQTLTSTSAVEHIHPQRAVAEGRHAPERASNDGADAPKHARTGAVHQSENGRTGDAHAMDSGTTEGAHAPDHRTTEGAHALGQGSTEGVHAAVDGRTRGTYAPELGNSKGGHAAEDGSTAHAHAHAHVVQGAHEDVGQLPVVGVADPAPSTSSAAQPPGSITSTNASPFQDMASVVPPGGTSLAQDASSTHFSASSRPAGSGLQLQIAGSTQSQRLGSTSSLMSPFQQLSTQLGSAELSDGELFHGRAASWSLSEQSNHEEHGVKVPRHNGQLPGSSSEAGLGTEVGRDPVTGDGRAHADCAELPAHANGSDEGRAPDAGGSGKPEVAEAGEKLVLPAPASTGAGSKGDGAAEPGKKLRPLFVPIVVVMDAEDHRMVAEERLGGPDGLLDARAGEGPCPLDDQLRRLRVLQDYVGSYQSQGLPVIHVQYGNFGAALDDLHEYILECIKVAMERP